MTTEMSPNEKLWHEWYKTSRIQLWTHLIICIAAIMCLTIISYLLIESDLEDRDWLLFGSIGGIITIGTIVARSIRENITDNPDKRKEE